MRARITTYGGENHTIRHWQLEVGGVFIADTSSPHIRDLYQKIVDRINWFDEVVKLTQGQPDTGEGNELVRGDDR